MSHCLLLRVSCNAGTEVHSARRLYASLPVFCALTELLSKWEKPVFCWTSPGFTNSQIQVFSQENKRRCSFSLNHLQMWQLGKWQNFLLVDWFLILSALIDPNRVEQTRVLYIVLTAVLLYHTAFLLNVLHGTWSRHWSQSQHSYTLNCVCVGTVAQRSVHVTLSCVAHVGDTDLIVFVMIYCFFL